MPLTTFKFCNILSGVMTCYQLLFMGDEFAQTSEWNFQQSLDWHLLEFPIHQGIHSLIKGSRVGRKNLRLRDNLDKRVFDFVRDFG